MRIGKLEVGDDHPVACIAELSNAANGKYENAIRLLDDVKAAGASAAKIQCYSVDELVALRGDGPAPAQWSDRSMRDLYSQAMTPREWIPKLFRHAESIDLPLFSSVFGLESLALLESCGNPCYKIARLDNGHEWLAEAVAATGKPLLVSESRRGEGAIVATDVARLYCPVGYPAVVDWLPWNFREAGFLGLSSHCLDPRLPIAAVARGAKLIEMHVMLDDEPSELEANISLTVSQFKRMVEDVRATERMLG